MYNLYKQFTWEGCLPACLLLLSGNSVSKDREIELLGDALKIGGDSYVLAILEAFVKRYDKKLKVHAHTKYYTRWLIKNIKTQGRIDFIQAPIKEKFISSQKPPYILYIDGYRITFPIHSPHFIIIETKTENDFYIINDPWRGKRTKARQDALYGAVNSLWKDLKFCPLLIKLV